MYLTEPDLRLKLETHWKGSGENLLHTCTFSMRAHSNSSSEVRNIWDFSWWVLVSWWWLNWCFGSWRALPEREPGSGNEGCLKGWVLTCTGPLVLISQSQVRQIKSFIMSSSFRKATWAPPGFLQRRWSWITSPSLQRLLISQPQTGITWSYFPSVPSAPSPDWTGHMEG